MAAAQEKKRVAHLNIEYLAGKRQEEK